MNMEQQIPPVLYIVIPCYNEETVLPITAPIFLQKILKLIESKKINIESRVLFVNDGSKDNTWKIINSLAENDTHFQGISLSRNRGHQNALLAGLMEAKKYCDISISIDCDGQDDIDAMDRMIEEWYQGSDIVYGVRKDRSTDTWFKRNSAQGFYKLLNIMGADCIYNHADYRLVSKRVLEELEKYQEVNLFLRGIFPLIGFRYSTVSYNRAERVAGDSHYPVRKMVALAFDGITGLSIKPIRIITVIGIIVSLLSFVGMIYAVIGAVMGSTVSGWASTICIICFIGGVQLLSLGVIGEYVGKTYMETKHRPRYIVSEKTSSEKEKAEDR